MFSTRYKLMCLLALLLCVSVVHADESAQLLHNGSFEQASPLRWKVSLYPRHDAEALLRVFSLTDDMAADGAVTARIDTNEVPSGAHLVIISQTHSAYAWRGQQLRLSAQSMLQTERNSDGSPLQLNVRQWGAGDRVVAAKRIDCPNYLGQWTTSSLEFDVEPDALRIDIQLMVTRNDDDIYKTVMLIDDVRLEPVVPDDLSLTIAGPEASLDGGVLPCRVNVSPHVLEATGRVACAVKLMSDDEVMVNIAFAADRVMQHVTIPLGGMTPGHYAVAVELTSSKGDIIATDAKNVLLYHGPFAGE